MISDPIERSEIQFHMQKEWRDHFVERCTYLRLRMDATMWLRSVDKMDRRVAWEKNRRRMIRRRVMMGKAMEKDVSECGEGVFIERSVESGEDFLLESGGGGGTTPLMNGGGIMTSLDSTGEEDDANGDFGRMLLSMLDDGNEPSSVGGKSGSFGILSPQHQSCSKKSATLRSSSDPNFRYAAPFLAGITSYIEKNGVPFEHVDIWVPSALQGKESESGGTASGGASSSSPSSQQQQQPPQPSQGSNSPSPTTCRLYFAGSATLGVQVVDDSTPPSVGAGGGGMPSTFDLGDSKRESTRTIPLTNDEIFNFSLYGDYSEKFSFSSGCGLPGRVFQSGVAAWEQFVANAPPHLFERRGGAMQFGIKTALGLPIESSNVGRIVLVLYSKHNRDRDDDLVNRMVRDIKLFSPRPRWKLVVDVCASKGSGLTAMNGPIMGLAQPAGVSAVTTVGMPNTGSGKNAAVAAQNSTQDNFSGGSNGNGGDTENNKGSKIKQLISLLGENMPSDQTSPLGKQLDSIMSLRLLLLRSNRTPEEETLVETLLVLFESYLAAGRTRPDIALLVTRDFSFHMQHIQQASLMRQQQEQQQSIQQQQSLINMPSPMIQSQQQQQHHHHPPPPNFIQAPAAMARVNSNAFMGSMSHQQHAGAAGQGQSFTNGQYPQTMQSVMHSHPQFFGQPTHHLPTSAAPASANNKAPNKQTKM